MEIKINRNQSYNQFLRSELTDYLKEKISEEDYIDSNDKCLIMKDKVYV